MPQKNYKFLTIYSDKYIKTMWKWILWMVDQFGKSIVLHLAKFIDMIHLQEILGSTE